MAPALLTTPTLVVEQRRRLFEMRNRYRIFDESGAEIATVEQETQSPLAFLARLGTDLDVALPVTLQISDTAGSAVLNVHKPWFRMTLEVSRPDGTALGSIVKRIRLGKARFSLNDAAGSEVGEVRAENWRAKDFSMVDHTGQEVARAAKRWRGLATELFTDADTYVVQVEEGVGDPLRSLTVAASLAIDLVLKQKDY